MQLVRSTPKLRFIHKRRRIFGGGGANHFLEICLFPNVKKLATGDTRKVCTKKIMPTSFMDSPNATADEGREAKWILGLIFHIFLSLNGEFFFLLF